MRILTLLFLLAMSAPMMAQSGQFAGAPFRVGHSAYSMSLGNAVTASNNPAMSYFNPALVASADRKQLEFSTALMSFDRKLSGLTFTTNLPPKAGLTIGLVHSGVSQFDGRTLSGYPTERFDIYEAQLFTQFGIRAGKNTQLGVGIKFSMADYGNNVDPATSVSLDLGMRRQLTENAALGITVQDIIGSYTWNTQDLWGTVGSNQQVDNFPMRLKTGLEYQIKPFNVVAYGELEQRVLFASYEKVGLSTSLGEPFVIRETVDITNKEDFLRLGAEWFAHERLHVRAGWQSDDRWAAGFSLYIPLERYIPVIDYTVASETGFVSILHQFAFRFQL